MRYEVAHIESYYKVSHTPSYYKVSHTPSYYKAVRVEVEDAITYMVDSYGNKIKDGSGNYIILPQ